MVLQKTHLPEVDVEEQQRQQERGEGKIEDVGESTPLSSISPIVLGNGLSFHKSISYTDKCSCKYYHQTGPSAVRCKSDLSVFLGSDERTHW